MESHEVKIDRVRRGEKLRVLELCSGVGGMALGFQSAGFQLAAHVESSKEAAENYARNFLGLSKSSGDPRAEPLDMTTATVSQIRRVFGLTDSDSEAFDIVVAGLPCQAFARVGRSKLRSIAGSDDAHKSDPRAVLYLKFLEFVSETEPLVVVLENVPDILNFGGTNIPEEIAESLEEMGYQVRYSILNSAFYGVPQFRERLILVAYHSSLKTAPTLPSPTHYAELPSGYTSSRTVALKHIPSVDSHFIPIAEPHVELRQAVTAAEAIEDLPVLKISGRLQDGSAVTGETPLEYSDSKSISEYARSMRRWPNFESGLATDGHIIRKTPRDHETFALMSAGDDYPSALKCATARYNAQLQSRLLLEPNLGEEDRSALQKAIVPPYDASKFPNKWWKMRSDRPVRTLTAHLGKDTYSHIHYDSSQKRMLSVREAARLQSFPDGFVFGRFINAALRQIGNAVPPLLAKAVAGEIVKQVQLSVVNNDELIVSR